MVDFAKKNAQNKALRDAIEERDEIVKWMSFAKTREMELRKYIAAQLFPAPDEGKNTIVKLGLEVTLGHKLNRKLDVERFDLLKDELTRKGVPVARLVEYNPALVMKEYRALLDQKRKLFDQVLTITPSAPELDINLG